MKVEVLNNALRRVFHSLIGDGYKKRHICALTLGVQSEPQFEGFMQGRDFNTKPLQRIIDAFGYELQLVVIDKENEELKNYLQDINEEFFKNCKTKLVANLDNKDLVKSSSVIKSGLIADVTNTIFDQIST
jgi:hypothetical protein